MGGRGGSFDADTTGSHGSIRDPQTAAVGVELRYRAMLYVQAPDLGCVYRTTADAGAMKADAPEHDPVARPRIDRAQVGAAGADNGCIGPRRVDGHALRDRESGAISPGILDDNLAARLNHCERLIEGPAWLSRRARVEVAAVNRHKRPRHRRQARPGHRQADRGAACEAEKQLSNCHDFSLLHNRSLTAETRRL